MKPWLAWTRWLNPFYCTSIVMYHAIPIAEIFLYTIDGFEAAMINEFHDTEHACAQIVPSGGDYSTAGGNFACTTPGSVAGQTFVSGDAYLKAALDYSHSHLWRNVGSECLYV